MQMVCLDFEGVLAPEIWQRVADDTGIEGLRRTTRDVPDYAALMADRVALLREHGIRIDRLRRAAGALEPLEGARAFLDEARARHQVTLLSDTFYELAGPLFDALGRPNAFCHRLDVDAEGRVAGWRPRLADHKRRAVEAFRGLGFPVAAVGDSYNDLAMLDAADAAVLFRAPERIRRERPDLPATGDYGDLLRRLDAAADKGAA